MHINEPEITNETIKELGLSEEEFERIKIQLDRTPNYAELCVYAVIWSEPESLKSAQYWLNSLPNEDRNLLADPKFNQVGLYDLGDGSAFAVKITAHNFNQDLSSKNQLPHSIENIHQEIFSHGARPLASLNSMRIGSVDQASNREDLKNAIEAIGKISNCYGVPMVGGDFFFHPCFNNTGIINTFSLGIIDDKHSISSSESDEEMLVFLAGSTFCQKNSSSSTLNKPFVGKLLMEAALEALPLGKIIAMAPLSTVGLAGACAKICARLKLGMHINLENISSLQNNKLPHEILIASAKDQMILVLQKDGVDETQSIFEKWDLQLSQIGQLAGPKMLEFYQAENSVANFPLDSLINGSGVPLYQKEYAKPEYLKKIRKFNPNRVSKPKDYIDVAKRIWQSNNVVSKRWAYEQFDSRLGANTISQTASDSVILRIKNGNKALSLSTDCNPTYVKADPYIGTMIAVSEAARNIICSGGEPLSLSPCLNFADPDDAEHYWQFVNSIKGLGDVSKKFELPIIGGQVNFLGPSDSEKEDLSIFPSPTIALVGLIDDTDNIMSLHFKEEGHQIYMLGTPHNDLASSIYLRLIHNIPLSPAPKFDLDEEFHNLYNLKIIIRKKMIQSAHDISEGGLFVSLLEAAIPNGFGIDIETDNNFRKDAYLFGESQSRIIVSVAMEHEDELVNYLNSHNVSFSKLGEVIGRRILIDNQDFGLVKDWKAIYNNTLGEKLDN